MRWIRKIVYGLGFRPRPGSIFFSPSWVLNAASRQAYAAFVKGYRECELSEEEKRAENGELRMSGCISVHGEYSDHILDDLHTCTRCSVLDEDALRADLARLREEIERLANVILEIPGEPGSEGSAVDVAIRIIQETRSRYASSGAWAEAERARVEIAELGASNASLIRRVADLESQLAEAQRDETAAIADRDEYHDIADKLAAAIARLTGLAIGEHSSMNDPWDNALVFADQSPGLPRTPGVTDDGLHCQHWYDDDAAACCRCGLGGE